MNPKSKLLIALLFLAVLFSLTFVGNLIGGRAATPSGESVLLNSTPFLILLGSWIVLFLNRRRLGRRSLRR